MARPVEERLARQRRQALLLLAAFVATLAGILLRGEGGWTTFLVSAILLVAFIGFGTVFVLGPWTKEGEPMSDLEVLEGSLGDGLD
jgi:cyanate permease